MEKPVIAQPVKKHREYYGTGNFIYIFTRYNFWELPWATWIRCTPSHLISFRTNLISSFHLRLYIPCNGFPWRIRLQFCKNFLFPSGYQTYHPSYYSWFDHPNNIFEGHKFSVVFLQLVTYVSTSNVRGIDILWPRRLHKERTPLY
jgi:hypothetical protein